MGDEGIIKAIERMQALVELGRLCREKKQVGTKMPLLSMKINNQKADFVKDMKTLEAYIKEELAVEVVEYTSDDSMVQYAGLLNFKSLGKKLGKDLKVVMEAAKKLTQEELKGFEANGEITIAGHKIGSEEMTLERKTKEATNENFVVIGDNETIVEMDFTPCARLIQISKCNEIKNRVQKLRKDAKLKQDDPVDMWAMVTPGAKGTGELQAALKEKRAYIDDLLRRPLWPGDLKQGHEVMVKSEEFQIEDGEGADKLTVMLTMRGPFYNLEALKKLTGGDAQAEEVCKQ